MQIEETFRDLKSPQYSVGLRHCKSRCPRRLDILLLIAMLAEIVLWLIGIIANHLGWQRHFQANTIRHRPVLSVVRLGKEVRKRKNYKITEQHLHWAMIEYIKKIHCARMPQL